MLYIETEKGKLSLPQTKESMRLLSAAEKREIEKPVKLIILTEEETESEIPLVRAIIKELGGREILSV